MSILSTAENLIGKVSYVFGSNDIEGGKGDCSSFTQYVFKQNGVDIGRTTFDQVKQGTAVDKNDLQAGDLVFFQGTYNTSGASHVGIYKGNGKFIDLGSSGVRESDLNSEYWSSHYLTARRISGVDVGSSLINTNSGATNTGWLGNKVHDIMMNVSTVVIIALLIIIGLIFFIGAWGVDINPKNMISKVI